MLRVTELARRVGISAHSVRYYTRIGLLQPARRGANGYKEFAVGDINRLLFIRRARHIGFTLAEISQVLRMSRRKQTPCPLVREIMQRRLSETTDELEHILQLKKRIARALEQWRSAPDSVPTGDEVCRLIESMDELEILHTSERGTDRRPRRVGPRGTGGGTTN